MFVRNKKTLPDFDVCTDQPEPARIVPPAEVKQPEPRQESPQPPPSS